jgi:hypothetical protein
MIKKELKRLIRSDLVQKLFSQFQRIHHLN